LLRIDQVALYLETEMANRIDTVTARARLTVRREPYWHRISRGFHLGFRKMSDGSTGTWLLRYRDETGREVQPTLGSLDEYKAHERFDRALCSARNWLERATKADSIVEVRPYSVWDACSDYVQNLKELKGEKAAYTQEARYLRWVHGDPIRNISLPDLTRDHLIAYRRRMVATPVKGNKANSPRERSKDTVNRDMAAVRAALNYALSNRKVQSDFAWREPLKAFKNVSKRRGLYLDREQRQRLVEHAASDLAIFLRGLSVLPLRPGALAALMVGDYDFRLRVLRIGTDKSGQDRRIKLPEVTATMFEEAARGREANAPLLSRKYGQAWNKDAWKDLVKDAARMAGLPPSTTAYTLRHRVITDLVHGGLDLLTVAQISGTSVTMIEKHYGHLRSEVAVEALAKLVL
jgi:integrase